MTEFKPKSEFHLAFVRHHKSSLVMRQSFWAHDLEEATLLLWEIHPKAIVRKHSITLPTEAQVKQQKAEWDKTAKEIKAWEARTPPVPAPETTYAAPAVAPKPDPAQPALSEAEKLMLAHKRALKAEQNRRYYERQKERMAAQKALGDQRQTVTATPPAPKPEPAPQPVLTTVPKPQPELWVSMTDDDVWVHQSKEECRVFRHGFEAAGGKLKSLTSGRFIPDDPAK